MLAIGLVSGPMSQSKLTLADDRIIVSGKKNHSKECNKMKKKFHRKVKKKCTTSFGFFFICSEPKKKINIQQVNRLSVSQDGCPELENEIRIGDMKPTRLE